MHEMKQDDRKLALLGLQQFDSRAPSASDIATLSQLATHPYQWIRIRSAELLGEVPDPAAVLVLATALNDRSEYVAVAAAESLAKIQTPEALNILRRAFADDEVERPHYLANAIAAFGDAGFALLRHFSSANSPTLRYFAARGLGSTGMADARPILESMRDDSEETSFGGRVSTAANRGLRTLQRIQDQS